VPFEPELSDANLQYYTTGFENIEWVFNTVEEMRTSKRAIRRYGFVDLTDTIIMANRLEAMGTLYRLQKLVRDDLIQSVGRFQLLIS
jgi:hypothetical protein